MRDHDVQQISPMVLVYGFIFIAAIALTYVGFNSRNPFLVGAMALIPFMVLLTNQPHIWLMTVIILLQSKLRFPGMPGNLDISQILLAGLLCLVLAKRIIIKTPRPKEGNHWFFLYMFLLVLVVTMVVRGVGFQVLGDSKQGGMRYVRLLIAAALPIMIYYIPLRAKQWRFALIGMGLMALLPAVADGLFILSHGSVYHQFYFLQHGGTVGRVTEAAIAGEGVRYAAGSRAAAGLLIVPYLAWSYQSNRWKYVVCVLIALALAASSGHRLSVITTIAFVWTYGFSTMKQHRIGYVLGTGLVAVFLMLLAIPLVNYLPYSVQRSLAWIPFLEIDPIARQSAAGTAHWRLQVWANALHEIPNYLLLGKGYAYDGSLAAALLTMRASEVLIEWPKIMVAYHNGPLSLVIGMGLFGLIGGIGLLVATNLRHLVLMTRGEWHDPILRRLHHVVYILFFLHTLSFLLIYGDVPVSFPGMFIRLAILEGLWYSNRRLVQGSSPSMEQQETKDVVRVPGSLPTRLAHAGDGHPIR